MGIKKYLSKQFWAKDKKSANPLTAPGFSGGGLSAFSDAYDSKSGELGAYKTIHWVAVAIDKIQSSSESQDWFFESKDGEKIDNRRVPAEILMPFEKGYRGISFKEMVGSVVSQRALTGNAFLRISTTTAYGELRGFRDSFMPISPKDVTIKMLPHGAGVSHYEVDLGNGHRIDLDPDEVIHFRQNAIFNPFIGVGNIQKMRLLAEGITSSLEYTREFMGRRATPSLAVLDGTQRVPDEAIRIGELMSAKYEGKNNAGRLMYLNGENVKVQELQISNSDMQFVEIREMDRQAILSVFGVPLSIAGIPDANFSTARTSRISFLSDTVNPVIRSIENSINEQFVHKIDDGINFRIQKHATGDIEVIEKMVSSGLITPNRGSQMLGEEISPDDDFRSSFYVPSSLIPMGATPDIQTPQDDKPPKKKLITPDEIADYHIKSATNPKRFQGEYIRRSLKSTDRVEKKFLSKISSLFESQKKDVLKRLSEVQEKSVGKKDLSGIDVDILYSLDQAEEEIKEVIEPVHTSAVQRGVEDINSVANAAVISSFSNPFVKAAVGRLGRDISGGVDRNGKRISIAEYSRKELENIIIKGVEDDWSINEFQDNIIKKFDQWGNYRARMIARTEARKAWDAGAQVAYQEIGVTHIDIVGCTEFEADSDCGKQNVPLSELTSLVFHPNHKGTPAPSEEV